MRKAFAAALALGLGLSLSTAARAEPLKVVSEALPTPVGVSAFLVHSDRLGHDIQVAVHLPQATAFLPGQKFPVIYALDSGYGVAGPQGTLLAATGAMAPAIVVSVGYANGQAGFRNTDLTHGKVASGPMPFGGGGAAFEAFLLEDLRPMIEAKYPADPKRSVLFGHSLGGLFAANVFADRPDAFSAYIIGSASAWADPAVIARVAAAAPKAHGERIYLTVGALEDQSAPDGGTKMADGFNGLAKALKDQPGVILRTQVYAGETHLSYYPKLVTDGFAFVLPPIRPLDAREAALPPETVARYLGVYDLPDGRKLTITHPQNSLLTAQVTGIPPVPLLQNGKDRYYAPTSDIDARFDGASLTMTAGGGASLKVPREKTP
jgi:predicted alpha/beta superfamily hydrolase